MLCPCCSSNGTFHSNTLYKDTRCKKCGYEWNELDRNIQDYDEAIRLDPQDAIVYNNRGYAYGKLGQYERAIQDYDEAIRLNPQDAIAYYNRGLAYETLGQLKLANRDFAKAKELGYDP